MVTDQGTQFMGDVFKRLCKLLKIGKLNTSAYHPESNGALERTRKTMVEYLRYFATQETLIGISGYHLHVLFTILHFIL